MLHAEYGQLSSVKIKIWVKRAYIIKQSDEGFRFSLSLWLVCRKKISTKRKLLASRSCNFLPIPFFREKASREQKKKKSRNMEHEVEKKWKSKF